MNEKEQAKATSQEVMRETGFPPPDSGAVIHSPPRFDLAQATKDMEQRIVLVDRIHTMIQKQINPETDISKMGNKCRRTINFARKCYRIVGGSIEWATYPSGLKYVRESMQDEQGSWYAITVSCTYVTPWGERVECFKRLTSREPFFGVEDGKPMEGSDVNESDIVEMAVTEAFKGAVFTALGFPKDISADEAKRFGLDTSKASGHDFSGAKGAQGGSADSSQESYDTRKQIEMICKRLSESGYTHNGAECPTSVEVLRAVTANPSKGWNGWGKFSAIKEVQLPRILEQLEKIEADLSGGERQPGSDG